MTVNEFGALFMNLVHLSARNRLHDGLRFKLAHVSENVQQRPLGSDFSVGRRIKSNTGTGFVDTF